VSFSADGKTPSNTSAAVWLAAKTGGQYFPSNDSQQSLERFNRDSANYYQLGFHAGEADGRYHRVKVRLERKGRYSLTYKEGYRRLSKDDAFERAMLTPFGIASQKSTLAFSLTVGDPRAAGKGRSLVPIHASIPTSQAVFLSTSEGSVARLHVYISVFGPLGQTVLYQHFVETITAQISPVVVSHTIPLRKGKYRIFVTVRDDLSDQVGVEAKEIGL